MLILKNVKGEEMNFKKILSLSAVAMLSSGCGATYTSSTSDDFILFAYNCDQAGYPDVKSFSVETNTTYTLTNLSTNTVIQTRTQRTVNEFDLNENDAFMSVFYSNYNFVTTKDGEFINEHTLYTENKLIDGSYVSQNITNGIITKRASSYELIKESAASVLSSNSALTSASRFSTYSHSSVVEEIKYEVGSDNSYKVSFINFSETVGFEDMTVTPSVDVKINTIKNEIHIFDASGVKKSYEATYEINCENSNYSYTCSETENYSINGHIDRSQEIPIE